MMYVKRQLRVKEVSGQVKCGQNNIRTYGNGVNVGPRKKWGMISSRAGAQI